MITYSPHRTSASQLSRKIYSRLKYSIELSKQLIIPNSINRDLYQQESMKKIKCPFLITIFLKVIVCQNVFAEADKFSKTEIGLGNAQIFDYNINYQKNNGPTPNFVWGATKPWKNSLSTFYIPYDRDPNKYRNIDWYISNKPDWVVYQCDKKTIANSYKYDFGYLTPLDINNNDVRNYYLKNYIIQAKENGYSGIAFDNVSTKNYFHRCGIYKNGKWNIQYSDDPLDQKYSDSVYQYFLWAKNILSKNDLILAMNIEYRSDNIENYLKIVELADIVVDETGFSRNCKPIDYGINLIKRVQTLYKVSHKRPLVIVDQTCKNQNDINNQNVEWTLANYLLIKSDYTYISISGEKYGSENINYKFDIPIEKPISNIEKMGDLYYRKFSNATVYLNPDPAASQTVNIGKNGFDINGVSLLEKLVLPPITSKIVIYGPKKITDK